MTKTPHGYHVRNSRKQLPFLSPFPPKLVTANFHSSTTKRQDNGTEKIFFLGNRHYHHNKLPGKTNRKISIPPTAKHHRSRREIDTILKSTRDSNGCANSTFIIKYGDRYKVFNNFRIDYRGRIYSYKQYRVTDDGLQVCNSGSNTIQKRWRYLMTKEKKELPLKHCNAWVETYSRNKYTLFKNFTVYFKPTQQSFTRKDYGVYLGYFRICSAKINLSCNEHLVKVKYNEKYKVFNNFSLSYHKKHYGYREYRLTSQGFKLCTSDNSTVQDIWKARNSWRKWKSIAFCRKWWNVKAYYTVGKQFNVFLATSAQSFEKHEYSVSNSQLKICANKLKPRTTDLTKEDMLLCKDSLIKINWDDEYEVLYNFKILYKRKVYHYTEYRVGNDGIQICNSIDNYVGESWKLRNRWVKKALPIKHCNAWVKTYSRNKYTLFKNFTVYFKPTQQSFTRKDYGVYLGDFAICSAKINLSCDEHLAKVH